MHEAAITGAQINKSQNNISREGTIQLAFNLMWWYVHTFLLASLIIFMSNSKDNYEIISLCSLKTHPNMFGLPY